MLGAGDQLARLARRQLAVRLRIDDTYVEPFVDEPAGRARGPFLTVGAHDRQRGLGRAEALDERLDAEPLLECGEDGRRRRDAVHASEEVVGVVSGSRLVPDEVRHHPDQVRDGGSGRADLVEPAGRAEPVLDDRASAGDQSRVDR